MIQRSPWQHLHLRNRFFEILLLVKRICDFQKSGCTPELPFFCLCMSTSPKLPIKSKKTLVIWPDIFLKDVWRIDQSSVLLHVLFILSDTTSVQQMMICLSGLPTMHSLDWRWFNLQNKQNQTYGLLSLKITEKERCLRGFGWTSELQKMLWFRNSHQNLMSFEKT